MVRFLCLVQRSGEEPPADGRQRNWRAVDDGRVFTGRQGVGLKLVDGLGNEKTAMAWLEKEKKVPATTPVRDYSLAPQFSEFSFLHVAAVDAFRRWA